MIRRTRPALPRAGFGVLTLVAFAAACTPNGAPPAVVGPTPGAAAGTPAPVVSATASSTTAPATPTPTPAPAGFAVTGTVLDDLRKPVAGATVTARAGSKPAGSTTTAADGTYKLELPAGDYALEATKAGLTSRTQPVALKGAAVVDFGQVTTDSGNPFFLSDAPEIAKVDVEEGGPGGPLTLRVRLSEPIPEANRKNFEAAFQLNTSRTIEFLRVVPTGAIRTLPEVAWEDDGKTFVFKYKGPYLASGAVDATYSVAFRQRKLDTKDPVTREFEWEDLKITDAAGNKLGRGRMDYAFRKPELTTLALSTLADFTWGYHPEERRWNLTHEGLFTFTAKKDDVKPGLVSVELAANQLINNAGTDILTLRFSEPMAAAKDRDTPEFTLLDRDKDLAILNVSPNENGSSPRPAQTGLKIQKIEFNRTDPSIVYFFYGGGTFDKLKWVEVTMGADAKDPAGNTVDPARRKAAGAITGTTI